MVRDRTRKVEWDQENEQEHKGNDRFTIAKGETTTCRGETTLG